MANSSEGTGANPVGTQDLLGLFKQDLEKKQVAKELSRSSGKSNDGPDKYQEVLMEIFVGDQEAGELALGSMTRYKDIRTMFVEYELAGGEWPEETGTVKRKLDEITDVLYNKLGNDVVDKPEAHIICVDANELVDEWLDKKARRPEYLANPRIYGENSDTSLGFEPDEGYLLGWVLVNRNRFFEKVDTYFDKEPELPEEPSPEEQEAHDEWSERNEQRADWYQKVMDKLVEDEPEPEPEQKDEPE